MGSGPVGTGLSCPCHQLTLANSFPSYLSTAFSFISLMQLMSLN